MKSINEEQNDFSKSFENVINKIEFTENELNEIKRQVMEWVHNGNVNILSVLLDKMIPDAK